MTHAMPGSDDMSGKKHKTMTDPELSVILA